MSVLTGFQVGNGAGRDPFMTSDDQQHTAIEEAAGLITRRASVMIENRYERLIWKIMVIPPFLAPTMLTVTDPWYLQLPGAHC